MDRHVGSRDGSGGRWGEIGESEFERLFRLLYLFIASVSSSQ